MTETALRVTDVRRSFGRVRANDGVSLQVESGQVVALLGHNGAGKTTLVSQILGLLKPDSGSIHVHGVDAVADPRRSRELVAVQPQSHAPVEGLTPRSAISISARIRGASRDEAHRSAETLGEELDISEWLDQRALPEGGGLSGGIRRLTSFAMAVAAPAPVLVLDEPTNDVDAYRRRRLWDAVRRRADQGAAVLLISHNVAEIERIIDRLVILQQGRVIAQGTTDEVRGDSDAIRLTVTGTELPERPFPVLGETTSSGRTLLTVHLRNLDAATRWAVEHRTSGGIESFSIGPATLEDVYLGLTADSQETDHA